MTVDLNCDLGEGAGHDAELMPLVTSANIACGAHAGDESTMRATVALALAHGVAIGAHPGFADREHFGRRELSLPPEDVAMLVQTQVERLQAVARDFGGAVTHVKLHGALYNLAAGDRILAQAVLGAIGRTAGKLAMVVPAGSVFEQAARATAGVRAVAEGFADRTYRSDGTLTPRSEPGAVIADEAAAVAQVLRMVRAGVVRTVDGRDVPIRAETICLHGDGIHAVAFARRLRREMAAAGVAVKSFRP